MAKNIPLPGGSASQIGTPAAYPSSSSSAIRALRSKPMAEEEEKWYKGAQPTRRETLAQIYDVYRQDHLTGAQMVNSYLQMTQDPSTPLYAPYTKATNPAIGHLSELGVDVSEINDDWFTRNASVMNHYRTGATGTPLAPSSTSSAENDAAYWYYKVTEAEETTKKAEAEWAALQEELGYWAGRSDRNYSDEEILARIDWSNYPTLARMDEGRKQGVPLSLNRAVGYSEDAIYGALWAARNDGGTGNSMADSIQYVLGSGNMWEKDARISALLDPTNEAYNPYAAGSTVDDEALYFGVGSFDEGWLERNRAMIASNDETERKMYGKVYDAEQTTLQAEAELAELQAEIRLATAFSSDADAVIASIDWRKYPTLSKMDKSLKSGDIMAMTRAVPYKREDILAGIRGRCVGQPDALDNFAKGVAAALAGAQKAAPVKEEKKIVWKRDKEDAEQRKPFGFGLGWPTGNAKTEDKSAESAEASSVIEDSSSVVAKDSSVIEDPSAAAEGMTADKQPAPKAAPRVSVLPSQATGAIDQQRNKVLDAAGPDVAAVGTDAEKRVWQYARPSQMPKLVKEVSFGVETSKLTDAESLKLYRDTVIPYAASNYHKTAKIVAEQEQAAMQLLQAKAEGKDTSGIKMPYSSEAYAQAKAQLRQMSRAFDLLEQKGDKEATRQISALKFASTLMNMDIEAPTQYAYSVYDSLVQEGHSPEDVAQLARADLEFYEAMESGEFLQTMAELYGGVEGLEAAYPGFAQQWSAAREAGELDKQDAKYFLMQFNEDFKQAVVDRPLRISDGPNGSDLVRSQMTGNAEISTAAHAASDNDPMMPFYGEGDYSRTVMADKYHDMYLGLQESYPVFAEVFGKIPESQWTDNLHHLTESELDTLYYIEKTQGSKKAQEFLDYLNDDEYGQLHVRSTVEMQDRNAAFTREHPVLANIGAVLRSPGQLSGAVYSLTAQLKGEEINPYNRAFHTNVAINSVRGTSKQMINESLGEDTFLGQLANFGYDIGVSLADSAYNSLLFGGASPYIMGTYAFGGAVQDAKFRGATDEQALGFGAVAFIAEVGSESVTQHVFKGGAAVDPMTFRAALTNAAKGMAEEGGSEFLTELVNIAGDEVIMGSLSNYNLNVERYMTEMGMSKAAAERAARRDTLMQLGYATLAGVGSGGVTSMAGSAYNYVFNGHAYASIEESRAAAAAQRMQQQEFNQAYAAELRQQAEQDMPQPPQPLDAVPMPAETAPAPMDAVPMPASSAPVETAESMADTEDADTVELDVDIEPATPAAETEPATRTKVLPPEQKMRAIDVLAEAENSDADGAVVTAVAAVLTDPEQPETASPKGLITAIALADRYGELPSADIVKGILGVPNAPVSHDSLQSAISVAVAFDGDARKVLDNIAATYRVQPGDITALEQAAQADLQQPAAQEAVQQQEHDTRIALRTKELIADGALDGMRPYKTALRHAEENLTSAQTGLEQAQQQQTAAGENFATVSQQHLQNPTDASLRGSVQQATKDLTGVVIVARQREEAVQKQEAAVQEAKAEHDAVLERTMKEVREQAVADVAAADQQEAERVAAEEAAAEEDRLNQNIAAVEAETFIEDSGYAEADDAQLEEVRQEVISSAARVPIDRTTAEFAARVSKRFHVPIRFVDDPDIDGAYDPSQGVVLLNRDATQGDVIRKLFVHELIHRTESAKGYSELRDALLQLRYGDDTAAQQADLDAIRAQYAGVYTKAEDFESELVAFTAEELLGNEDSMARLVADKPSVARRIWDALKNFVNKMRGVNDPTMDTLRRVEKLMGKALDEVAKQEMETLRQGLKYRLKADPETDSAEQYSYAYLAAQPDMTVAQMPDPQLYRKGSGADRAKAKADGIRNADAMKSSASSENKLFVDNVYTGTPLQINTSAIQHSIAGSSERQLRNAAAGAAVGQLAANAIPVNELIHKKTESQPWVNREYLYLSLAEDEASYYPVALVVQATEENLGAITHIEALEGIEKRYVYSVNAHQHKKGAGYEDMTANSSSTSTGSTISIANLLDLVKDDFADGFSADVLQQLGLHRPDGPFSAGVKFSLPSPTLRSTQINAWRNSATGAQQQSPNNTGERQFAAQTAQRSNAIPDWLKRSLWGDRFYERDTNRAQAERAFERIAGEGFDAAHERLMKEPSWNADNNVEALVLLHMALRPADQGGWGNPAAAMELAHRFNTEGTSQGQALQARQLFSRMTPTGMRLWAAGHAESVLLAYKEKHKPIAKHTHKQAQEVESEIGQYDGSDPLAPDENGDVTITPEAVQRWGVPVNERQQALIDHYRLNNTTRPGLFYNKATLKQRMLEAILATPDPNVQTGMGMTLVERLELMQAGAPVVTEADLSYIVDRMQEFVGASEEDQAGRLGDLALARAYEAYGNITPASLREKARTWRYTSMLLSIPSAARNVIGNAAQGATNAVAHDVAVLLDKLVSGVTHERTMALNTMQERAAGWHAFVDETVNTYRDHFIDRATTRRGNDRYNMNQRGRMFQTRVPEALRTMEGFLMSVGDRNVWRKAFVQSMAEQQRVADLNGADFDPDAATERALADANYATFSEDNAVSTALGALKRVPVVGDLFDFIMPFTGVPTNIVKRMGQYSPFGLAWNVGKAIGRAWTGRTFDQHAFVNGVSRGFTGTALMAAGMMLFKMGVIKLGTGEEEDKEYALHTAMGQQYTPYIQIGDQYYSLSALAPFISPLTMGASTMKLLEEDDSLGNAALNAAIAAGDQIFDASYMANLSDIFGGYGSPTENLLTTMGSSLISQNIPSILGQWASALDPYVRNTRDKDKLMQIVKSGLINKLPWLREELLPAKVDVAGRRVENTDQGVLAFVDPFNRTSVEEDPAMIELDRLHTELGTSSHLPSDVLSGTKTALSGVAAPVEGSDKEAYQGRYGELWRLGGSTFDASGNRVVITGVSDLIQSSAYQKMTDQQKANAISGIMSAAKAGAAYEMGEKLGHVEKESDSDNDEYTMKAVRAMPERFAGMSSEYLTEAGKKARAKGKNIIPLGTSMDHLTAWYNQTGDGAFIPKGISGSFSRSKVQYDLTGEELEKLWTLYEGKLEEQLSGIDWDADPVVVAQAVEKAYSSADKSAKDQYVKNLSED